MNRYKTSSTETYRYDWEIEAPGGITVEELDIIRKEVIEFNCDLKLLNDDILSKNLKSIFSRNSNFINYANLDKDKLELYKQIKFTVSCDLQSFENDDIEINN
jgi:hypothetical protein